MPSELPSRPTRPRFIELPDSATLRAEARRRVLAAAAAAIAERGLFLLVLAGGSTPREVYRSLVDATTDWSRWWIYFGDERCLSANDPERNSVMAASAWLDRVAIPAAQRFAIPAELGAPAGAQAYVDLLANVPHFDLVLLGLGEDAHTASLFPGDPLGDSADSPDALPVLGAPKPPSERVSLSAHRLSRAREVLFLVDGAGKRDALARWRNGEAVPAAAIRPAGGVDVLTTVA